MPFRSQAQKKFLFAKHPDIAKRWAKEYPSQGKLPARVKRKAKKKSKKAKVRHR